MPISLKHVFVSAKADGSDSTKVQASNWNDEHTITMATDAILGRTTTGTGDVEELTADDVWTLLGIVTGTEMLFRQTTPPTGWTKNVSINDDLLRVTSGTAGQYTGGSPVSTIFQNSSWGTSSSSPGNQSHDHYTSGTTNTKGSHTHTLSVRSTTSEVTAGSGGSKAANNTNTTKTTSSSGNHSHSWGNTSDSSGGGSSHSHSVDLRVDYVDCIIASKD